MYFKKYKHFKMYEQDLQKSVDIKIQQNMQSLKYFQTKATMSNEFSYACDKCPRTFKMEEFFEKHKKVHDLKKQHKCDICGFVYGAAKGLEGHIKTHTDEEIAAAHQVNQLKIQQQNAAASANNGSPSTPFGMEFKFLNPQGVLAQAKLPVSPKKDSDDFVVKSRDQLNGKAPSPAGTGNYTIYDNISETVPEVNDAEKAVQNDSGFFMCSICKREFSGLNSLKKHIPIHTRKVQHKCDVCGYVFGKKEYLLDHMRKHTGEVSPICEVCGQTFNKSLKLKEHFKLHRNVGPTASMSPYKCHICQSVFARPDSLGNHLTVAHAETVYKCDICEATFGDVRGKNHHMYNEHQLDAFHQKCVWCPVCNQGFTRHYNLKVHMYKSHGKEYIENNFSPAELAALMKSVPSPPAAVATASMPALHPAVAAVSLNNRPGPLSSKKLDAKSYAINRNQNLKAIKKKPQVIRKPGPASKTNAPPEKRGCTSLPTYLQLTQVSRRSSSVDQERNKENSLSDIVRKLAEAAASKEVRTDEKQTCNFCPVVCKNQTELSLHLVNDHFKGLIPLPMAQPSSERKRPRSEVSHEDIAHERAVIRAKQIRQSLGLDVAVYRRPGPKSLTKLDLNTEGTISDYKTRILPSTAVLSASKISSAVASNLRPVVLSSSNVPPTSSNSVSVNSKPSTVLRPPTHIVNMMLNTAAVSNNTNTIDDEMEENNNNNNNDSEATNQNLMNLNLMNKPRKKSECPVCGIILSPKTNVNVHLRTHSGVRPYECVLCLNRFRQKAHLMKHFRCTHNQKQPPHICLFCSLETATSNDLYRHITDAHSKETDELRPSLLAQRSDAAAAAKEAASLETSSTPDDQDLKIKTEEAEMTEQDQENGNQSSQDVRYEPITEDFMFEDRVIAPCYVVLPYVSDEEIEAAGSIPNDESEMEEDEVQDPRDYLDDEAPLTIDESAHDDEPELPRSPLKPSDFLEDRRQNMEYNAEDINGHNQQPGFYPAMADYSLPFSMANIWKKKAEEITNFNPMEHLALMQKIDQMSKFNGSVVYNGPPSPPSPPRVTHVNGHHHHSDTSPKKPKTKPTSPNTPKEKKFISNGNPANQTPVADYENQIKNDIWPLDCIKCNSLLGNLDNFNLHMNDHWSDDKCCPVCGLLINSKRFNFKQHLKIHTGEKPFTCNICNRSFRQKAHMVKHVTTHRTMPNGGSPLALEAN